MPIRFISATTSAPNSHNPCSTGSSVAESAQEGVSCASASGSERRDYGTSGAPPSEAADLVAALGADPAR